MIIFFPEVSRSLPDLLNTEEESDVVDAERVKRSALCPGVCSAKTFMLDFLLQRLSGNFPIETKRI